MVWATPDGLRGLLRWAADALAEPATVRQQRSWNLSGLFRLTTSEGDFWLKAVPPFAAQEGAALRLVASVAPGLVPGVVAAAPGRTVLRHAPGEDLWQPESAEPLVRAVRSWVAAQAALAGSAARAGLPDLREHLLQERARTLVRSLPGLTADERRAAHELAESWAELRACGLPTTVVHGDFHPGNLRGAPDGGDPVVLDFADAHLGNPALDGFRLWDYSPEPLRAAVADAWVDAWRSHAPGADPERALALARRLGPLQYALRYQEFLDGVEPSERVYHEDDPLDCVRAAVSSAPPSSNSLTS
ncbi:aminoglycoside phosphotransferase family protein [Streptacidiphilus monticola]